MVYNKGDEFEVMLHHLSSDVILHLYFPSAGYPELVRKVESCQKSIFGALNPPAGQLLSHFGYRVKISQPVSVMRRVCSNWALGLPSAVLAVQ
jgi:hypothetical protein